MPALELATPPSSSNKPPTTAPTMDGLTGQGPPPDTALNIDGSPAANQNEMSVLESVD
jgi:hypothetical protein